MSFDVALARSQTPGCEHVVHLNNAGAALLPRVVLDTVVAHLRRESEIGGYEAAAEAAAAEGAVYDSVARLVGCDADEVALVDSATRAWTGALGALALGPGDRVVTGRTEYASNMIALLQLARRSGVEIDVVGDDEHGQVDVAALADRITDRTRLIALTHVPTNDGVVNPAAAVGEVARAAGVPFLLDACQSAGQLSLDVGALGCDALAATGRKFLRGPRGTGFLYVRRSFLEGLEPAPLDLRSADWVAPDAYALRPDARRFETWERSVADRLGLGAAVDLTLEWGLDAIEERVVALGAGLRDRLSTVPGVQVCDRGRQRCGIVTFRVAGHEAVDVQRELRAGGINVWVSAADTTRFDAGPDRVRASVHYFTTVEELDLLADRVARLGRDA